MNTKGLAGTPQLTFALWTYADPDEKAGKLTGGQRLTELRSPRDPIVSKASDVSFQSGWTKSKPFPVPYLSGVIGCFLFAER